MVFEVIHVHVLIRYAFISRKIFRLLLFEFFKPVTNNRNLVIYKKLKEE